MTAPIIQGSFASGELSPSLTARVDLAKFHSGAALLRNFFVDYRGGISNRPGTIFVGRCARSDKPVRLIKFQYNIEQTYVLEFGHLYFRVIKDGGYVLEAGTNITAVTNANPGVVTAPGHTLVNGDTVYLFNLNGMTQLAGRTFLVSGVAGNNFNLTTLNGALIDTTSYTPYINGGAVYRVYTPVSPYDSADLARLKFVQSADTMTFTHPDYPVYDLTRTDHNNWTFTKVSFDPAIDPPTSVTANPSTAGSIQYSYCVTAVDDSGNESLASPIATALSADLGVSTALNTVRVAWNTVAGALLYRVYKTNRTTVSGTDTTAAAGAQFGLIGSTISLSMDDSNILPDYSIRPPVHIDPFAPAAIDKVTVLTQGTGYTTGTILTISDGTGGGAVLLPIVVGGSIVAVSILRRGKNFTAPTISASIGSGATFSVTLGPSTGIYPAVTAYYQQRKVYASTKAEPQRWWMSQPGLYKNFDKADPTKDDDAVSGALVSREVNDIRSMLSMPSGLMMLTGGGAWQINGGSGNAPITPRSAQAQSQNFNGVSYIEPIVINHDVLYVQAQGSVVRDMSFNYYANVYTGVDITVLSNHFFYQHQIVQWAYAEEPFKLVWAVRDDGKLLSLTFLKEQDVYAWASHDTLGRFEDVCTIIENNEAAVYLVVKRFIGGVWLKYVEKFASRKFDLAEDAWFLDSALALQPEPLGTDVTLSATPEVNGSVIFTADSPVFSGGHVGYIIRMGGGIGRIYNVGSANAVTAAMLKSITELTPNDLNLTPQPTMDWSIGAPVTQITGLDHLNAMSVRILADGNMPADKIVVDGQITLDQPASKVIVGLPYTAQFKSLPVDTGEPTVQGKMKRLPDVTFRVESTRDFHIGRTFDTMYEVKTRFYEQYGRPVEPKTDDLRISPPGGWDLFGQICVQQFFPFPITILGVIPKVTVGG